MLVDAVLVANSLKCVFTKQHYASVYRLSDATGEWFHVAHTLHTCLLMASWLAVCGICGCSTFM